MSGLIISGVICAIAVGIGKLVLKVVHAESVPPYVAALELNETQSVQVATNKLFKDSGTMSIDGNPIGGGSDIVSGNPW